MRIAALLVGLTSWTTVSYASNCATAYTVDDRLTDLNTAEFAAQGGEGPAALTAAKKLQAGIGCLDERLMPAISGRTYRTIGAGLIVGGDESRGRDWLRTALEVDPLFDYGVEEYADDHVVRRIYSQVRQEPAVGDPDTAGSAFGEGKFFLDGRTIREPAAMPGRPHLLQRDLDGVTSWVIEGANFPDEALFDAGKAVAAADGGKKAKKDKKKKGGAPAAREDGAIAMGRDNVPEKIPLVIGGAVVSLGAGAMYGGAILTRQRFEDIKDSEDDLRRARLNTNRLHMGSIALLAVGVGTTTWGIIIDNGTPMPHFSMRF